MALIKPTAFVDEISGAVQGSVFSHNQGGDYVRGRGLVANPGTNSQQFIRTVFAAVSQRWRKLTDGQRQEWIDAKADYPYRNRLGDKKELTGKALFQKLNLNLILLEQPKLFDPPTPEDVVGFTDIETAFAINDAPELTFKVNLDGQGDDGGFIIYATPGMSPGVKNANIRKVCENG